MLLDIISRPTTTEDLVRRLQNPETNANERVVLQTLASKMVGIFKDDKSYVHIREAAAVAPFEDWSGYKDLLWTFMDAVIDGTADGSILRPELCDQFVRVLRLCDSIDDGVSKPGQRPVDLQLELVMVSLQRRLEVSIGGAGLQAQYQIVDTLGRVLDAMNDAKTAGISRERYRESLLKSLDELGDSNEIRLAQAASYAYEALRGIPDDEGPYKALLRHGMGFVQAGAKIAGAVPTMDPSKLVDGLIALADVPDLVSSMVDVVEQISEAVKAIRGVAQDVKLQRRPKKWYIALRFADILIQAREFPKVVEFIRDVPCRLDFDFLRGLYARLERAWVTAGGTQVWYADAKLRDYYLDDCEKLLQINRISGERLSMAHCYINLAIVEKDAEDSENTRSQSTLAAVLKVDDALEEQTVTLDKLLEPRKCHDGSVRAPRRLLIRGRAGVGKTTFCKKIMHEFTRQPVDDSFRTWTERYDRILWLPLRNLKRHRAHLGYSLAELLKEEFFPRCLESTIFSKALDNYSSAGYGNSRTLFLLDGLDEVSDLLDSDHKMAGFLRWLLQQPNAIITSRPGGNHTNSLVDLDCEMETVGFHTREVWAYIGQTVKQVDAKIAMRKFLDNHPLLLSLMRIPVQLDAFCYIWDGPSAEADKENLSTITSIYQSIERRLWYKDIPRLRDVTVESALELTSSEADELVQGEKVFLQALAFAGLYHDVVDFQLQECDDVRVSLSLGESKLKGPLSDTLGSLSFLRTSDVSAPHGNSTRRRIYLQRTYHFIHLTYQEYFAAQYFVSCWTDGTRLDLSKFGNRKHVNRDPIDFLQQNKYQSRFNIFWRFVAGILRDHDRSHNHAGGKKHLAGFFGILSDSDSDTMVSVLAGASQETKKHVIDAIGNVETTLTPGVIGLLHTWLKGRPWAHFSEMTLTRT
ncbi:hypothetical protein SBRCBS47491_007332 [Sporothrix bragantina]|uniref:NACHT domain-containing protein n=1 Tax=Sporothrix bragantina TaxID=671064 RepID=A0ABP0CCC5_9PEZI